MTYNITIDDNLNSNIQYLIDNNDSSILRGFRHKEVVDITIEQYLQSIIDSELRHIIHRVDMIKDQELLNTVKSDSTLLTNVNEKIQLAKAPK